MRLRLWLLILPLLVAGTQIATAILDQFAPPSYESAELFSRGNESHAILPVVVALGRRPRVRGLPRGHATRTSRLHPSWTFACLPPLIFTLQEHVEYVVGHGHIPWLLAANPVFLAGLALQVPFAIAAYVLAHALLDVAVAIAERRCATRVAWRRRPPISLRPGTTFHPRRLRFAGGHRLTRGPPDAIVV